MLNGIIKVLIIFTMFQLLNTFGISLILATSSSRRDSRRLCAMTWLDFNLEMAPIPALVSVSSQHQQKKINASVIGGWIRYWILQQTKFGIGFGKEMYFWNWKYKYMSLLLLELIFIIFILNNLLHLQSK